MSKLKLQHIRWCFWKLDVSAATAQQCKCRLSCATRQKPSLLTSVHLLVFCLQPERRQTEDPQRMAVSPGSRNHPAALAGHGGGQAAFLQAVRRLCFRVSVLHHDECWCLRQSDEKCQICPWIQTMPVLTAVWTNNFCKKAKIQKSLWGSHTLKIS